MQKICMFVVRQENPFEDFDDVDKAVALLKKEIQGIPMPVEFTNDVQAKFLKEQLKPFVTRLDNKLAQFDDLFASNQDDIHWLAGAGRSKQCKRGEIGVAITGLDTWQNNSISQIGITFSWNGFIKGKNAFSATAGFMIRFDRRSYSFMCSNPTLNREFKYGSWFSEDEMKSFISAVTKMVLDTIQQQIKNSPKW